MKVRKKLDLGADFDDKLRRRIASLKEEEIMTTSHALQQEFITEVRRLVHQAYKLGQENPNV